MLVGRVGGMLDEGAGCWEHVVCGWATETIAKAEVNTPVRTREHNIRPLQSRSTLKKETIRVESVFLSNPFLHYNFLTLL